MKIVSPFTHPHLLTLQTWVPFFRWTKLCSSQTSIDFLFLLWKSMRTINIFFIFDWTIHLNGSKRCCLLQLIAFNIHLNYTFYVVANTCNEKISFGSHLSVFKYIYGTPVILKKYTKVYFFFTRTVFQMKLARPRKGYFFENIVFLITVICLLRINKRKITALKIVFTQRPFSKCSLSACCTNQSNSL